MMVNQKSSIRKKSQGDYPRGYVSSAKRGLKEKLFLALAVLMLCACSSDDELESTFNGANATGGVTYLTVNLREVGSSTRASNGGYASGTEHNVANAYFYFYDDKGNYITSGNVSSTTGTEDSPTSDNKYIEWNSNTVVAVWGLEPDNEGNLPTQMLTVINQPSGFNITGMTLSEATKTLAGTPYADASGNFVMSTSVYEETTNHTVVSSTALKTTDFATEPVDLKDDYPNGGVDVYVERLAAKVGLSIASDILWSNPNQFGTLNIEVTNAMLGEFQNAPTAPNGNTYVIRLHGWNVDGVARDAYIVKDITPFATSWTNAPGFSGWNDAPDYRCYWASSPNYGEAHDYPISSKGNTDTTEDTAPLDEYLRYVSLSDANTLALSTTSTTYAYCGENTNTVAVLGDASSTALTNVILKAQFGYQNLNLGGFTGVDLVKYNSYLYTADEFCQARVNAVDFATIIDGAIAALELEDEYSALTTQLEVLKTAAANGSVVYSTDATPSTVSELTAFGGEMLSLYNAYDGNVTIGYNMDSSTTDNNIVYNGLALDGYNFWFSVDADELSSAIEELTTAGLLVSIGDNYYIPLSAEIELTEGNSTMRSYFLSALATDAATTNSGFGTNYPNYYKEGLMYYSVPIEHLATAPLSGINEGQYGVVRNHWYDISVTSISSFGRGIAAEDEVIVPISDNEIQTNSIGASTKIYSWKEYDQTVIF